MAGEIDRPMTPHPPSAAWRQLRACVERVAHGPWRFIQLRGESLDDRTIDGDDVDLLGSRSAVEELLAAAYTWVQAGECHLRIHATTAAKVALTLFSHDGAHRADFDLWLELWQLEDRTRCLRYEAAAARVLNPADSLQRLPPELEAAIYVHHLISKRKDLTAPKVAQRLAAYAQVVNEPLRTGLRQVMTTQTIEATTRSLVTRIVNEQLAPSAPRGMPRLLQRFGAAVRTLWLAPPRRLSIVALMGCDGSGKTTLGHALAEARPDIEGVFTGKHLYRKSWGYKLLVIFIRPLLLQDRESFDETFAPVAYLRACLGLRAKLWRRARGILLLDRSLADFVFVGRKTEQPRFARSRWLTRVIGRRISTVHLVLPFARVQERKQEMTRTGHAIYDHAMFRHFTALAPVDYVVFNNAGPLPASAAALGRILAALQRD
jgi:hypothetical protein